VTITWSDAIVGSTKVGGSSNEIDVVVAVIVLLKINWCKAESR
jgi:hypothetical protein